MKKIKVKLCSGRSCETLGGPTKKALLAALPPELADRVKIKESDCIDYCGDDRHGAAPHAKVKGLPPIPMATVDRVVEEIRRAVALADAASKGEGEGEGDD